MRMMLLAFAAVVVVAAGAGFGLNYIGYSSQERLSSDSVRLN